MHKFFPPLYLALRSSLLGVLLLLATVAQAAVPRIVLDMEGSLADTSGNDLVTLAHGGSSFVSNGVSGQALSLDGTGYLELPYDLMAGSADFTVDFWFKTTTRGGLLGYQRTVYPTVPSTFVPIIAVQSDGHLRTEMWSTINGVSISSPNVVNDGAWHRVVLTADATNQSYNVYLDGTLLSTASAEILHLQMSFNQLGVVYGAGTAGRSQLVQGWDYFTGQIDQFVLYADALPASEVAKTAQFITFAAPADQSLSNQSLQLSGSSSSALPVSYTSVTLSVCSVSGTTLQLLSAGTCTVSADQDGDATYSAASAVSRSFEITTPSISLSVPADIAVDATALFSRIDLGEATGQDASGEALIATHTGSNLFRPGRHQVTWRVEDGAGGALEDTQQIDVYPLVSLQKNQSTSEGETLQVQVVLNGEAPVYPFTIAYTVSGSSDATDHDLLDGQLVIASGRTGSIEVNILSDSVAESDETLVLTLTDDAQVNPGAVSQHTITISEENIAPLVSLQVEQSSEDRHTIGQQGGVVTVSSNASDPNQSQSLQYDWSGTDNALINTSNDSSAFVFDPSGLAAGVYSVVVAVQDDGVPALTSKARTYVNVVQNLATLEANQDSDGDGVDDTVEGLSDTDRDGIPDYLDSNEQCNVLPQQQTTVDGYLVEADSGVCLRMGNFAMNGETGGSQIVDEDIASSSVDALSPDTEAENVGGIFDFHVTDLSTQGQVVNVVIPQRAAIPENAIYRKLRDGNWQDFSEGAGNRLRSAAGEMGYCPPPESAQWTDGLSAGDFCVQLTIVDGGLNDDDSEANQTVVDPGGVAVRMPETGAASDMQRIKISGGSMGWWVLVVLFAYALNRQSTHRSVFAIALSSLLVLSFSPIVVEASQGVESKTLPAALDTSKPWYGSLMVGEYSDSVTDASLQREYDALGSGAEVVSSKTQHLGVEFAAGYHLRPNISVEFALLSLGQANVIVDVPTDATEADIKEATTIHPQSAWGAAARVRGEYLLNTRVSLFGKLGLWAWKGRFSAVDTVGTRLASSRFKGTDPLGSIGLHWRPTSDVSFALEHSWVKIGKTTSGAFRLGLLKRF